MKFDSGAPNLILQSGLGPKDRITILLSEYTALRAEIVARTGYGFQLTAVGAAGLTWAFTEAFKNSSWHAWGVLTLIAAAITLGSCVNVRDLKKAANRVKALEHEINSRAGEHLLIWETLSGPLTRMGLIRGFFSRVKSAPRSKLPPLDPAYLAKEDKRGEVTSWTTRSLSEISETKKT